MIHLFYIPVILGLIALVALYAYYYHKQQNNIAVLLEEYDKLDQGMTEITDAYETDSLQYEETIENLNVELARHRENNRTLLHNARVDMTARHELQRRNDEQAASIDGLRRQLDIAQVIILEHDQNCLPHIVLKSMEPEEDTPLPI